MHRVVTLPMSVAVLLAACSSSADARSFALEPYPVDAIMCGNRIVWIGRDLVEQQPPLAA